MPAPFLLRSRFLPRFLRWAVAFQLALALLIGVGVAVEVGQWGTVQVANVLYPAGICAGILALLALGLTTRRRNLRAGELTPDGIRPFTSLHGWDSFYRWSEVESVRVTAGPFGNRWLEVQAVGGDSFALTARPANPDGVLEALEQFAGPDHPLTRAYFTLLDR